MATRAKLVLGKGKGPKISLATNAQIEEFSAAGEQTSDLFLLSRPAVEPDLSSLSEATSRPAPPAAAPAAPAAPARPAKLIKPVVANPQPTLPEDLAKYNELQPYAEMIVADDTKNPYTLDENTIFPIQTRLGFQKQILKVFADFIQVPEFGKAIDYDACKRLGASAQEELEMYEYQKFVREYVRQATPYRGVLVYHGLGSGKTCSAIAAAEALFSVSKRKIIVMTPSSLRYNFVREVSFCGFRHFRYQNHWVKLDGTNRTVKLFAAEVLGLTKFKAPRLWVPDFKLPSNFNTLDTEYRKEITEQLEEQIQNRIQFINYNGISASKLKELACAPESIFDNAVIVVDEIHNLTRLMQGTIEPYLTSLPGLKRKVPLEPVKPGRWEPELCKKVTDPRRPYLTNYKRGYLLYRLLAGARNSKLIGLSGTPLINFPEEIAILVNMLGGYIHTSSFTVSPSSEANRTMIRRLLQDNPQVDFEEVEALGTNIKVMFTLLPEGMVKVMGPDGTLGVQRTQKDQATIQEITGQVIKTLTEKGMRITGEELKSYPLLPPVGEEFRTAFLNTDGALKNTIVLRKRIQGLVSYYRGNKPELMPTVTKDELVRVPFSPYSQTEYQRVRGEELIQQMEKKKETSETGGKMANLWAELYDLAKLKQPNSYRMASRQACNFAFPEGIARPRPRDAKDVEADIGKEKEIVDADLEEIGPEAEDAAAAAAEEEDAAIDEGQKQEAIAEAKEAGDQETAEDIERSDQTILIQETAPVAGELAPAVAAPGPKTLSALQAAKEQQARKKEECKRGILPGEKYEAATKRSKECLKLFASQKLRLFTPGKKIDDEIKAGSKPDSERLAKYSPKFAAILMKILEAPGSSLVYSQFLDMEGIGIFRTVLDINDFHRITIMADDNGNVSFTEGTLASLKKGPGVNRYLSFTGGDSAAVRNIALKVFNARFSELPSEMSKALVEAGFTGNLRGELCRVFCITSAGAEGLSLRNVRRVHIMEPFWNHVRTDQVKGRAVRICSHIDLEYNADPSLNERTVEVYTYCSVYDSQALIRADGTGGFPRIDPTVLKGDGLKPKEAEEVGYTVSAGIKDYVATSDEYLYQISQRKKKVLQAIQDLMKSNAVDCQINQYENDNEVACITIPGTPQQYAFHPNLQKDIADTSTKFKDGDLAAAAAPAAAAAASPASAPAAAPRVQAPAGPKTIRAFEIVVDRVPYLAVPVLQKGQASPFSYDLYARGDIRRTKKIGVSLADAEGNPTSDIELF